MREAIRKRLFSLILVLSFFLVAAASLTYSHFQPTQSAYAGAEVVGQKDGADARMLISSGGDDRVRRVVYFDTGSHATGGANTPVPSAKVCGMAGEFHYSEVRLTGTMAGTAPTLAVKWQNSKDNGTTWSDVGTWTTINATVTPATQSNTVADSKAVVLMNANTPVVTPAVMYGDCWRATYTMTGTGAAANFTIIGAEK